MDLWEWNKIAGGVLGVLLFVLAVTFTAKAIFTVPAPKTPGYAVDVAEAEPAAPAAEVNEPMPDFSQLLPAADADHGKVLARDCQLCHDLSKGGQGKIGPALWGVVGRPRASFPGYTYSGAMAASHEPWSYDRLYVFLKSPSAAVPGTKMSYAGQRSPSDRADLIAYLRTLADTPAPLPKK
jgi:cytochrome c